MKGIHRIIVQNKRIRYDFEVKRNITILQGDSATGKTTLIDMIQEYMDQGKASMIDLQCDKRCGVIGGSTWQGQLSQFTDSIIFIDEGNDFILSNEFASIIQKTDNYYVIVSREGLPNLPYSVEEIYGIHSSGKYGQVKQCYQTFYHIYNLKNEEREIIPEIVITEDSNAGYQFFSKVCEQSEIRCFSAAGKSNIINELKNLNQQELTVIIADGAAFGSEMNRIMKYIEYRDYVKLYVPESFEWLLLSSHIFEDKKLDKMIEKPFEYVDSQKYFSWEQFFTELLMEVSHDSYLQYNKRKLNEAYLMGNVKKAVLDSMDIIKFGE